MEETPGISACSQDMKDHFIVTMASSAGGLRALRTILPMLPADFPSPIAIVQHLDPHHPSMMADILDRGCKLHVHQAKDGDFLQQGFIFLAPPDRHLLINPDGSLSLSQAQLVHFVRPSADLLFESAAASFREKTIAVVLTGTGRDGEQGVEAVHKMGGIVIAQDEKSSEFFGMPGTAIKTGCVNFILGLREIAAKLISITSGEQP